MYKITLYILLYHIIIFEYRVLYSLLCAYIIYIIYYFIFTAYEKRKKINKAILSLYGNNIICTYS